MARWTGLAGGDLSRACQLVRLQLIDSCEDECRCAPRIPESSIQYLTRDARYCLCICRWYLNVGSLGQNKRCSVYSILTAIDKTLRLSSHCQPSPPLPILAAFVTDSRCCYQRQNDCSITHITGARAAASLALTARNGNRVTSSMALHNSPFIVHRSSCIVHGVPFISRRGHRWGIGMGKRRYESMRAGKKRTRAWVA